MTCFPCCMETVKKVQEDKELYEKLNDLHSKVYDSYQLEKQDKRDARYKYLEELLEADTEYQMAMNDAMVEDAKTKAIDAISNMCIFELLGLEKQDKQPTDKIEPNPAWSEEDEEMLKWLCRIIHTQRLDRAITLKEESELGEWIDKWLNHNPQPTQCEHFENYDKEERIRKGLIKAVSRIFEGYKLFDTDVTREEALVWLEKQKSVGEIVERCKTSWYNEGKIDGQIEGLSDDEKYQQGWHDALEKQGESNPYSGVSFKYNDHIWGMCARDNGVDILLDKQLFKHLEKQGEQTTDKVEPKFKVRDWITTTDEEGNVTTEKIIEFWGDKVRLIDADGFYALWPKHELNYYHLWTIDDAKDGDVLVTEDYIFIFKYILHGGVHLYCHYNFDDEEFDSDIPDAVIGNIHDKGIHFRPATKEQRDLLFKKMQEAGYEWGQEEKKLIKINEPKLKVRDWVVKKDGEPFANGNHYAQITDIDEEQYWFDSGTWLKAKDIRLWAINDAKDGDVLVDEYNNIGLYSGEKDDLYWHSCIYLGCDDCLRGSMGYHKHKNTKPATKEQRDLLFAKMKELGYEWDIQKKKVKKPIDEVESRFKEGDFIMNNDITEDGKPEIFKIIKVCSSWYDVENVYDGRQTMITFSQDYTCHLWTIDDAKVGDVLASKDGIDILIFRNLDTHTSFSSYYNTRGKCEIGWSNNYFIPATKEQRDLLFEKMRESGYELDKELIK